MSILSESNLTDLTASIGERYFIEMHMSTKLLQCDVYDHQSTIMVDTIKTILAKLKLSPIALMDQLGLTGFFTSIFTTLSDYNRIDYVRIETGHQFSIIQDQKQPTIQVTFIEKCQS